MNPTHPDEPMIGPLLGLRPGQRLLTVAGHPDDETIGPGGTLHRAAQAGIIVDVLVVACCTHPMFGGYSDPHLRCKEFNAACDLLSVTGRVIAWIDEDQGRNPNGHLAELVGLIESGTAVSLNETQPDAMLIPAGSSFHQDHHATHRAAIAAARLGGTTRHTPRIVLGYAGPEDIWSAADERRVVTIDTSASWPAKEQAIRAHASQLRDWPHPRSVEGIRTLDAAAGLSIGTNFAEQFVAYRIAC